MANTPSNPLNPFNLSRVVTYQDVLNLAAEAAGRTRDKITVKEGLMLQTFLATALREVWVGGYQWPELIPPVVQTLCTAAAGAAPSFSKNIGQANEMGDVLGVYTNNPQVTPSYISLRFNDQDAQVQLEDGGGTVYVEYMYQRPDLNAVAAANLLAYCLPERFRNYLAFTAAGFLVRADGQMAQGDEILALAQSEIQIELNRVVEVPRRAVGKRDIFVMSTPPAAGAPGR